MPDPDDLDDVVDRSPRNPYGDSSPPRADPPGVRPRDVAELRVHTAWRDLAACTGYPADWWHPEGVTSASMAALGSAMALCRTCPVDVDCLTHAVVWPETIGAWGGYTAKHVTRFRVATATPRGWRIGDPAEAMRGTVTVGTAA